MTAYAPGKTQPLRKISTDVDRPVALAIDGSGNLYVANEGSSAGPSVTVYAPHSTRLLRAISNGIHTPDALAFDASGNLFVANRQSGPSPASVTVYKGKKLLRTISNGVSFPEALAVDGLDNLYVANKDNNTVTVYAAKSGELLRTISKGLDGQLTSIRSVGSKEAKSLNSRSGAPSRRSRVAAPPEEASL